MIVGDPKAFRDNRGRITSQVRRVLICMSSGAWWSKSELAQAVEGSPHAMSARLSELRRLGCRVEKKFMGDGLYLYRLALKRDETSEDFFTLPEMIEDLEERNQVETSRGPTA